MSGEGESGFLGRWSRRKRGVEAEAAPAEETPPEVQGEVPPACLPKSGTCPIPGMEPIDLSTLPPIEELSVTSDLAPFLRPGIPAALRSAALRRMWSLDPAIRDYIGPVEYQWDFNAPGGLPNGFAAELVGDVKKLLAQAIGEMEEKPPAPEEMPPPEAAPVLEVAPPVMAEAPAMLPPGVTMAGSVTLPKPAMPAPALPEAGEAGRDGEAPSLPRRRHGGALPV